MVYVKREDEGLDAPSLTDIVVGICERDYIRIDQSDCESVFWSCANIRYDSDGHDTENF